MIYVNVNVWIVFDAAPLDHHPPYICICIFVYLCICVFVYLCICIFVCLYICVQICIFVFNEAPLDRRRPYKVELEPGWHQMGRCPCTCNCLPIDKVHQQFFNEIIVPFWF